MTAQSAAADVLAADLRAARCCDALAPCASCARGRTVVQVARAVARVPEQRKASR